MKVPKLTPTKSIMKRAAVISAMAVGVLAPAAAPLSTSACGWGGDGFDGFRRNARNVNNTNVVVVVNNNNINRGDGFW